jgi:hypothetical protein
MRSLRDGDELKSIEVTPRLLLESALLSGESLFDALPFSDFLVFFLLFALVFSTHKAINKTLDIATPLMNRIATNIGSDRSAGA